MFSSQRYPTVAFVGVSVGMLVGVGMGSTVGSKDGSTVGSAQAVALAAPFGSFLSESPLNMSELLVGSPGTSNPVKGMSAPLEGMPGISALPEGMLGISAPSEGMLGISAPSEGMPGISAPPEGMPVISEPPAVDAGACLMGDANAAEEQDPHVFLQYVV